MDFFCNVVMPLLPAGSPLAWGPCSHELCIVNLCCTDSVNTNFYINCPISISPNLCLYFSLCYLWAENIHAVTSTPSSKHWLGDIYLCFHLRLRHMHFMPALVLVCRLTGIAGGIQSSFSLTEGSTSKGNSITPKSCNWLVRWHFSLLELIAAKGKHHQTKLSKPRECRLHILWWWTFSRFPPLIHIPCLRLKNLRCGGLKAYTNIQRNGS